MLVIKFYIVHSKAPGNVKIDEGKPRVVVDVSIATIRSDNL